MTGGSRGLGAATVRRFASEGANVVINYASHKNAAEALKQEVETQGVKALLVQADVGDESSVKKMVDEIIATRVIACLASEDAKYMTGSVVVVDGGYGGAV